MQENKKQISLFKDDVPAINGEFSIVKENTLIRANYSLTLYEHRIMAVIASLMKPTDTSDTRYFFRVSDFAEYFGLKSKDIYTALKEVFVHLRKKTFVLHRKDDSKRITGWINWAEIIPATGIVEVSVDDRIRPYFLDIKESLGYTKYQLKYVSGFQCPHSYRLYEKLKEVLQGKREEAFYMSFEELKVWLGIEDQYHQFSDFRKRVLTPALEDINGVKSEDSIRKKAKNSTFKAGSDIKVEITEVKPGKKIIGIKFNIKSNIQHQKEKSFITVETNNNLYEVLTPEQNQMITEFLSEGVNQTIVDQSISKYGLQNLEFMYKNFTYYKKKKKPIDPAAYAAATLLNGYGIPKNEHERKLYEQKNAEKAAIVATEEIMTQQSEAAATSTGDDTLIDQTIDNYLNDLSDDECKEIYHRCKERFRSFDVNAAKVAPNINILRAYMTNHILNKEDSK